MKRAEARQGSRQFPPPLSKSNGAVCLQNMQMKCKSAEPWANGGGVHVDVVMAIHGGAHTQAHVQACGRMDGCMDGWMDGWMDRWMYRSRG